MITLPWLRPTPINEKPSYETLEAETIELKRRLKLAAILMSWVIEHTHDPRAEKKCREMLRRLEITGWENLDYRVYFSNDI